MISNQGLLHQLERDRRTGRTTRMLKAAIECHKATRNAVAVGTNYNQARFLVRALRELESDATSWPIVAYLQDRENTILFNGDINEEYLHAFLPSLCEFPDNRQLFVDPQVYETYCHGILTSLHQWDAEPDIAPMPVRVS